MLCLDKRQSMKRVMEKDVKDFFFSSRRRHTRLVSDWSSDVCSSDLLMRRAAVECSILPHDNFSISGWFG